VKTLNITDKTGDLIAIKNVVDTDDLMIINKAGITIRQGVEELSVMGRATQGVRLINLKGSDSIAAVTKIAVEEDEEELTEDGTSAIAENSSEDTGENNETPDEKAEE
jgi:DNA gyrase subunit A